jgi:hypothetical protein
MKKLMQSENQQKSESRGNQKENYQEGVFESLSGFICYTQLLRLVETPYIISHLNLPPSAIIQPPQ